MPLTDLRLGARVALADPVALGLVGSLLVAYASLGIGIVPKPDPLSRLPLLGLLRETLPGRALAIGAILAGGAVLLAAWLALGRDLRAGTGPGVRGLRRTLWLWSLPLLLTPPLFSRDAYSYAAQGTMVRHGYDPYLKGPWVLLLPGPFADSVDPLWATTPAPYGPLFVTLAGGVSHLTGDSVYLGVLGMRALALAGVVLLAAYLPRLAAACGVDPARALWLGLVNPLTLMHFVSGAHNDALMLGLIVAGLALALERHRRTSGLVAGCALLALAAGIKVPAAVVLGFVGHAWARRLRPPASALPARSRMLRGFALVGGTGVGAFALLTAVSRVGYGWLGALGTPGNVHTWLSPPTAVGMVLGGAARLLGAGDGAVWQWVDRTRAVSAVLAVLLLLWLLLRRRAVESSGDSPADVAADAARVVRTSALALFLVVVLGPVVQPWYLMWALVLVAAGGVQQRESRPVLSAVVGCVVVSQLNGSTLTGAATVPGALACLALTWVVVSRHRRAEALLREPALPDLAAAPSR